MTSDRVPPDPSTIVKAFRLLAAGASIAAIAFVDAQVVGVNSTTAALTFLLPILAMATRWGLPAASFASVVGVIALNYKFLPPVGTFIIADPQNWVALSVFLMTAIVASHLSASVREQATEATRRQHEMEQLYALGRSLLLADVKSVPGQLIYHIAQIFGFRAAALYDRAGGCVHAGGPEEIVLPESRLRDAAMQATAFRHPETGVTVMPVSLGGTSIGSLALLGGSVSDAAMHAIANLAAIALERGRAEEAAGRAEAARQNQELKSALLDALAHEFKTPLTSIKAAVSGLLEGGELPQQELLTIIEEETDHLDSLVTEAVQMARLEAGQVRLESEPQTVRGLVETALRRTARALEDRELRLDIPDGLPPVLADRDLTALVVRQLVGNSLKYAGPASPISIRAVSEADRVRISVSDQGPGIPKAEQDRIFDRFYRAAASAGTVPGTGMGLAIARDIVEAHGGALEVSSRPGEGSCFSFTLPAIPREAKP